LSHDGTVIWHGAVTFAQVRYPERAAGGYTRVDGTVAFCLRVHALLLELPGDVVIVNFGAGRGAAADVEVPVHRWLKDLRGPGRHVIGLDIDPVVTRNPLVDSAQVIPPSGVLPLADASVDLVFSEWTFEHVDDAGAVAAELGRILKPGGWICACTPNRWGYIALGARLVPNRLHVGVLRRLQPTKQARDTFPTRYRMNTRRALTTLFPSEQFEVIAFTHDAEPYQYSGSSRIGSRVLALAHRLPARFKSMWFIYIQKKNGP